MRVVMAGGGTGGHVVPLIAVARELEKRGHEPVFVGTATGHEARLVPAAGYRLEYIEIGGLKRVGVARTLKTLYQLPLATAGMVRRLGRMRAAAVFSLGGYAAGPVVLAAAARRMPVVLMEPNAVPGMTNRWIGRVASRALVNFEETARWFPKGKAVLTGIPVRPEFFSLPPKPRGDVLIVLITGGSGGARTLNRAARESWELFRSSGVPVRIIHQTGAAAYEEIAAAFASAGLDGRVVPFIDDMPAAFAGADLVVARAGAGTVGELAAAGKPSILCPFPFAADDHQTKNAEVLARGGAARLVPDAEMNGRRLFDEIMALAREPETLERMGAAARGFARPGAAARAAEILESAVLTTP
ncbi:MAG: undecaprenyldiphospho-muramoylpentapeptide beta-N-acetylglucosaminyltransferase [bacterium]|jgi:UDP-N-acetylglucosamine--N-acetylmuramyl-(pentapeptide) pyrophosphoryl-undecaprenol N-acetylglucosamine transferase